MQLTKSTDYGVRLLIYLALQPEGKLASIDEISDAYDLPRNTVVKVVHQLGKAGVIETRRGKGGGFLLGRKATEINIGEVVELLEGPMVVVDCDARQCKIKPACELKRILNQATLSFVNVLKAYTVADLVGSQQDELIEILAL